jgi:hypothetical protein
MVYFRVLAVSVCRETGGNDQKKVMVTINVADI